MMDLGTFTREFPGESQYVEFKQGVSADRIARAVDAFSNSEGGVVLIGVSPEGRPVGTNTDSEALARLHRIVATVHDGGRYDVGQVDVDDRAIAVVSIARRRQGFAQTADGQVVCRKGAMNVALMGAELADFVRRNALTRFESTPTRLRRPDADPGLLDHMEPRETAGPRPGPARARRAG